MKIAILAFGSLINNHSGISLAENFKAGGAPLPLEFSRISSSGENEGCLTLVVDPTNGTRCSSFYAESSLTNLSEAMDEFQAREGANSRLAVGFINLKHAKLNSRALELYPNTVGEIGLWAENKGFEGVIWSNLRPNFQAKTGYAFDVLTAMNYIRYLTPTLRTKARNYIRNTHSSIQTPLRRAIVAQA